VVRQIATRPTVVIILDGDHAISLDCEECKNAYCVGSRVDIDAVWPDDRPRRRRVAMDDELAEISIALKELISVPKQAFVTLPTQWYAGFDLDRSL
jgi:hypothetical protein